MSRPVRHSETDVDVEPVLYGYLRDGRRKEMTLGEENVEFHWTEIPIPWLFRDRGQPERPWGYICRYPHVRRVWIEGRRLFVETEFCVHWLRFRRRDAAEAERCRRFIEDRIAPPGEIEVGRAELEGRPESYHGRRVRVKAWVWREFEGSLLIWDRDEYLANRMDPLGRRYAFDYVVKDFDGSVIDEGRSARPMPNLAFWRTWVAIHAQREFLEVAGETARSQTVFRAPDKRPGWFGRVRQRLSDWVDSRRSCHITLPDPDEGINLRFLEGLFGPMTLHGIFETGHGTWFGHVVQESLLTVYHVSPADPDNPPASS